MPFGDVGKGEIGTYFIGYARSPHRIEQMPVNTFVGQPPGNYDRLLDYSRAVTGTLFFVPSACEEEDAKIIVTSHLTRNFPGSPVDLRYFFTLEGDKISSLEIIP